MVMKDKLVKNHHKGIYFTLRKWTLIMLASATFIVAIVVPTYIVSHINSTKQAGIATEEPVLVDTNKDDNDEDENKDDSGDDNSSDDLESETFIYEEYIPSHSK